MLSLDRLRALLPDSDLSEAELEHVRDDLQTIAEVALAQWRWERDQKITESRMMSGNSELPAPLSTDANLPTLKNPSYDA